MADTQQPIQTEPEMVTITKAEYDELLHDSDFLMCLRAAGVDNWCGYSDAHDMMEEEED